mmetsp:Transcript_16456/g.35501  ORF Transcript_16456/g.35501 Transcript_16456/m.35501 type:complete len:222 (-) Transcript_16456:203-868(-)|eukprot:CAMPEP_0206453064 /NCGR_PEP_ID=MMETSP0324_2-20121206/20311_1 /ASSEMBLY_ACC=CAM_ASM_000836 /TAXON_ID=2866 /ORGANISM="Crypthecodinium cohnii, Strain Seligo" /LENGTH=221 /DNA_ID=CAMNT_0053923259 /DNA_START=73 /DNA_END=738 /DNA_ORIENTATION=-
MSDNDVADKAGHPPGKNSASAGGGAQSSKKHSLNRKWCLYVGPCTSTEGTYWSPKHTLAYEFDTVEDFWCMQHHSHPMSDVDNVDYLLFKKDADDEVYYKGGRWVLCLQEAEAFDEAWLGSVLPLIGESFESCGADEVVVGVGFSVNRKGGGCKVELWIGEPADEEQVLAIGRHYQSTVASVPKLWEKASQVMRFEDFSKHRVVVQLVGPKAAKSTAGIFQ